MSALEYHQGNRASGAGGQAEGPARAPERRLLPCPAPPGSDLQPILLRLGLHVPTLGLQASEFRGEHVK